MSYLDPVDLNTRAVVDFYDELPLWSAPFGLLLLDRIPIAPGLVILDVAIGLTATGGTASLPIVIPNDPALAGGRVHLQGVVIDPGVNFTGVVVSNGGTALLAGL